MCVCVRACVRACVRVCVCVRARAYGAIAQLVREASNSVYFPDLAKLQVQVTVMASYGILSLGKKLTRNCLSRLRSINEYLVFD